MSLRSSTIQAKFYRYSEEVKKSYFVLFVMERTGSSNSFDNKFKISLTHT